ncbi:MAG: FKBP-type peptidyl-prolyl cis-trans isomerase [Gammaproteobacteria bacterium]|nr:FKBP-type peptidyl-prolyl cis-trans isomerase [Gammaproteobacteria bacterium]TVQ49938.1 MAG: FKBP-type peptidyl-prolyl cis-trans isomerase [Gammaproteobacteria bacterium]
MLRVILISLAALLAVFLVARSSGLTPQQIEDRVLLASLNAEEGADYRRQEAARPGVISLPSGVLVEVLVLGEGQVPGSDDWVRVHYRGSRIDGREFDNSWRREEPATLPIERAIGGWQEVLAQTPVGTRLWLVTPPEQAYGRAGAGLIGPEETLVFELELLAIVPPPVEPVRAEWEQPVPNLR